MIDAAIELLDEGGVEALSMRALSSRAAVSVPTIYNLIGGRDEVIAALLDRVGTVFDAEVAVLNGDPVERCFAIAERILALITDRPDSSRSIIGEGIEPMFAGQDNALFHRYGAALLNALTEAESTGRILPITNAILLTEQLVSLTAMRIFRWASESTLGTPDDDHLHAAVTHNIAVVLLAVSPEAHRAELGRRIEIAERTLFGDSSS